jgi:hypothetical protein
LEEIEAQIWRLSPFMQVMAGTTDLHTGSVLELHPAPTPKSEPTDSAPTATVFTTHEEPRSPNRKRIGKSPTMEHTRRSRAAVEFLRVC